MWIVRLALRRPYTFVVGALLVVIFGVLSILRIHLDQCYQQVLLLRY